MFPKFTTRVLFLIYIISPFGSLVSFPILSYAQITPSQVLVIYNQDWKGDHPLTQKGQDSKEIANYYVKMHTDPLTGEKPYILGLSAKNGQDLNRSHLAEKSRDNKSGVILAHIPNMIGSTRTLRDGRLIEFKLPGNTSKWNLDTLNIRIGTKSGKISDRLTIIDQGKNLFSGRVKLAPSGKFTVRLNGTGFRRGPFTAFASCTDKQGRTKRWKAGYHDIKDVKISHTGPDNTRDDKNYLEYVEIPIKKFLEDPANALEHGRLLKDHILYFVISYGLPRTCIATYGIERGITSAPNNFGSIIDLGQRLQMMYYDFDQVVGTTPRPYKFDTKNSFSAYLFRAPQTRPLYGPKVNPFLHPDTYNSKTTRKDLSKAADFTVENRQKNSARHLYFSMRLDGKNPVQAKSLIDRSIYAQKYATPRMGVVKGQPISQNKTSTGSLKYSPAGKMFWKSGYKRIFYNYQAKHRLELFRLPPSAPFFNQAPVYLPGGVATTVISNSGWNTEKSDVYRYLRSGISVTACAARVYKGAPHIHNKSFWDDTVFYPAVLNGKTAGEAFLMNQTHLEWITCFIGDPLLRLPQKTAPLPEILHAPDIEITLVRLPKTKAPRKTAIQAHLRTDSRLPKVAQMKARPVNPEQDTFYVCDTFDATPHVVMDTKSLVKHDHWMLYFMDPFGRETRKLIDVTKI